MNCLRDASSAAPSPMLRDRLAGDQPIEQVTAGRVDDVQEHREDRDPEEVTILEDQRERAALADRLLVELRRLARELMALAGFALIDDERHGQGDEEDRGADEHQRVRREFPAAHERLDRGGAEPGAERRADADQREQPAALAFRVEVVRERPELRDHEDVENPHPDEEREAFADAVAPEHGKDQQVDGKKQPAHDDQTRALHARRDPAVERDDPHQEHRLRGRRVGLHLGAALREDQPVARGFQQVVAGEQQEHVEREQHRADALAGADVREHRERPLEPRFRGLADRPERRERLVGRELRVGDEGARFGSSHG